MATYKRVGRTAPAWGDGSAGPGGGSPVSGGAASLPGAGGASPTGWVNVQDYLRANQGQADEMGSDLAGKLEAEATRAIPAAEQYRSDANTYANAPKETLNPEWTKWVDMVNNVKGTKAWGNPGVADAYMSWEPVKNIAATPGPVPGMPSAPGAALEKIKTAGTAEGRATMFADKAGPSYNAGQSNLDSYLAGAGAGGQAIQGLGQKFGSVLDLVRFPYPGALPQPGSPRPESPNPNWKEPGTIPIPDEKKPGDPITLTGAGPTGPRPGDAPWQPSNGKRKRFA